jgi:hypothetical protein
LESATDVSCGNKADDLTSSEVFKNRPMVLHEISPRTQAWIAVHDVLQ